MGKRCARGPQQTALRSPQTRDTTAAIGVSERTSQCKRKLNMKTNEQQIEAKPAFEGYHAKLITGEVVWVRNRNDNATLKATGEKVCALKIQERVIAGWQGWSGGCRPFYAYLAPRWVLAEKVLEK